MNRAGIALAFVTVTAATLVTVSARDAMRPPLPYSVEDTWRSLGGALLANDGKWIAYDIFPEQGDGILVIRNLRSGREYREARGERSKFQSLTTVSFTDDSRYVVFLTRPASADSKAGLGILDLTTGSIEHYERVASFKLPQHNSNVVAILTESLTKSSGAELIVRDLGDGSEQKFADVVDYGITPDGQWLAYATKTTNANNGVYLLRIGSNNSLPLLSGQALFANLTFSNDRPEFAFITDIGTHVAKRPAWSLYYWDARLPDETRAVELVNASTSGMPPGYAVSTTGTLTFSKDGNRLFLFTAPLLTPNPPPNAKSPLKVDIWWSRAPELLSMQKLEAPDAADIPAMVRLPQRRFLQLGKSTIETLSYNDNPHYALGLAGAPYRMESSWRYADCTRFYYCDVYLDDLVTGKRTTIERMSWFEPLLSPGGRYIANFSPATHAWYLVRTSDLHRVMLSLAGIHFAREDWDQARPPVPYGMMGWAPGDRSVYIYDRYDLWAFNPDTGVGRNVTAGYGRHHRIELRYVDMRPGSQPQSMPGFDRQATAVNNGSIDLQQPVILLGMNDVTKAQSFYRMAFNATSQPPTLLTRQNVLFGYPIKARNANVVALTRERFNMVPDLYVTTMQFSLMRRVSDVEPRQREYAWGSSHLIDYVNANGRKLQAILTLPGNFSPRKKYPMIVSVYEDRSQTLNQFEQPEPENAANPNIAHYASNGYVVLQPDIVYTIGRPGWSAVHCIVPAVQRVVAMGFVNPRRIGLAGHSWGGFESEFVLTHTHIFAAIAAGAGLSDLLSWYDELRSGFGSPGAAHLEVDQGRMGGILWDRFDRYLENSPVFSAPHATAPFLMLHNDDDSSVMQSQSLEMFLALRRLGKQAWLINYHGEDHLIARSRDDQKDWTIRMDQFFDHYLKGAPTPAWMLFEP